jgi:CRISPR-associated protein Cas5h
MDTIIFDLIGELAHFRKFYTNSSSLSYSIPTRTSVMGIIAAILGYDKDSYYETFSEQKCEIAIEKLTQTRKINQTLNYIKATSRGELINPKQHTQIPVEIIKAKKGKIKYRIYFSHIDQELMNELEKKLKKQETEYPVYLGAAPFLAQIEFVDRSYFEKKSTQNYIKINTIIPADQIEDIKLDFEKNIPLKEKMPYGFNKGRVPKQAVSYVIDENCQPIEIKTKSDYSTYNGKNIMFT